MLETFHTLPKATEVLPWTIVVKDVIRRDTQTRAARQVHTLLDPTAEHGFTKNPCWDIASGPTWGAGTDDEGDSPAAVAPGNGGCVRRGPLPAGRSSRRAAYSRRRGSLCAVREARIASASGGHERVQLKDVRTTFRSFSRRPRCSVKRPALV